MPSRTDSRSQLILLVALLFVGTLGTLAELVLLEHTEDWQQWIPVVLLGLLVVVTGWQLWRPGKAGSRVLWWLGTASVISGLVGVWLHLQGNLEFEREMSPEVSGWPLWKEVLMGATPALAPGTMVWFGALALIVVRQNGGGRSAAATDTEERA